MARTAVAVSDLAPNVDVAFPVGGVALNPGAGNGHTITAGAAKKPGVLVLYIDNTGTGAGAFVIKGRNTDLDLSFSVTNGTKRMIRVGSSRRFKQYAAGVADVDDILIDLTGATAAGTIAAFRVK